MDVAENGVGDVGCLGSMYVGGQIYLSDIAKNKKMYVLLISVGH